MLTTLYPPSTIDAGVPEVKLKLFAEPDLSFHTLKLLPELNVIEDVDVSAPSSHKAQFEIAVGEKAYAVLTIDIPYFKSRIYRFIRRRLRSSRSIGMATR